MRDLLADPPEGVTYVTYPEAMASGELEDGPSLRPGAPFPRDIGSLTTAIIRSTVYGLRKINLLLPDPVRWWHIRGTFDLIHAHCFPLRLSGNVPPVIVTDSTGTFWHWTATMGYSEQDVWRKLQRERQLAQLLRYVHPTANPDAAASAFYFAESGKRLASALGISTDTIGIAPPGVPDAIQTSSLRVNPPTILFIAHNFELKGGAEVLQAFDLIRQEVPNSRLLVAGSSLPDPGLEAVTWLGPMSRIELYRNVYPVADIFLYPSRADTYGLVIAEALAHGLPVIAPRAFAIPDLVQSGHNGILVNSCEPHILAEASLSLLRDLTTLRSMSRNAMDDFREHLSPHVRNRILGGAYRMAFGPTPPSARH